MKKLLVFFVLLLAGAVFFACSDEDRYPVPPLEIDEGDSIAIADLISTFSLDETSGMRADDINTWKGVTFERDAIEKKIRVVKIELYWGIQKNGLPIPATIANLTHLREFFLVTDCTKPALDNCIFNLPLERLVIVCVYPRRGQENYEPDIENGLPYKAMGELSKDVVKLKPTIKYLKLGMFLGGEIPQEIVELDAEIDLSGNAFTGKVPLFVRDCKYPLNLSDCQFTEMDWRIYTEKKGNIPTLKENHMSVDIPEGIEEEFHETLWELYYPQYPLPDVNN